jgi:hypothetical protein
MSVVSNIHCTKHWYVVKKCLPQKWLFRNIITLFIQNTTLQMWASQPLKIAEWHILLSVNKVNIYKRVRSAVLSFCVRLVQVTNRREWWQYSVITYVGYELVPDGSSSEQHGKLCFGTQNKFSVLVLGWGILTWRDHLEDPDSGWGQVAGSCEGGNEPLGSIKCGEFLD